jgi:hypothetical protein
MESPTNTVPERRPADCGAAEFENDPELPHPARKKTRAKIVPFMQAKCNREQLERRVDKRVRSVTMP